MGPEEMQAPEENLGWKFTKSEASLRGNSSKAYNPYVKQIH